MVAMTKEVLIPWRREVREGFRETPLIEKAGTERTKTSPEIEPVPHSHSLNLEL